MKFKYDFFISHAVEDQKEFVNPLVTTLEEAGFKVWYSGHNLAAGESISRSINQAIKTCKSWIVIFSENFFKEFEGSWVERELDTFIEFEKEDRQIIPIFWEISYEKTKETYPLIARNFGINSSKGFEKIVQILSQKENHFSHLLDIVKTFDSGDRMNVLILPFNRMVEYPDRVINEEKLILTMIQDLAYDHEINLKVKYFSDESIGMSQQEAETLGFQKNADLVIWGDLINERKSVKINLRYLVISPGKYIRSVKSRPISQLDYYTQEVYNGHLEGELKSLLFWVMGIRFYWNKEYQKALNHFLKVQGFNSVNQNELAFRLGVCYDELKNYSQAIAAYQAISSNDPIVPKGYLNLGNLYLDQGEFALAQKYYLKSLETETNLLAVYNNLAVLAYEQGHKLEAEEFLNKAQSHIPKSPKLNRNIQKIGRGFQTENRPKNQRDNLLKVTQFRSSPYKTIEEFEHFLLTDGQPIIMLHEVLVPLPFEKDEKHLSGWALEVGTFSDGVPKVNQLDVRNYHLRICKKDLSEDKKDNIKNIPTTVESVLFRIDPIKEEGYEFCKIQFVLPEIAAFYAKIEHFLAGQDQSQEDLIPYLLLFLKSEYGYMGKHDLEVLLKKQFGVLIKP